MCGESGFVDVTVKEAHLLLFWGVCALTAELKKKIRKRRKGKEKRRNRKRSKDTRIKSGMVFLCHLYFSENSSFQRSSKAEHLTARNLFQSNIRTDGRTDRTNL